MSMRTEVLEALLAHADTDSVDALLLGLGGRDDLVVGAPVSARVVAATRKDAKLATMVAHNLGDSEAIARMARSDRRVTVRRNLASNPHTDADTLEYLYRWALKKSDRISLRVLVQRAPTDAILETMFERAEPYKGFPVSVLAERLGREPDAGAYQKLFEAPPEQMRDVAPLVQAVGREAVEGLSLASLCEMVPGERKRELLIQILASSGPIDEALAQHILDSLVAPSISWSARHLGGRVITPGAITMLSANEHVAELLAMVGIPVQAQCDIVKTRAMSDIGVALEYLTKPAALVLSQRDDISDMAAWALLRQDIVWEDDVRVKLIRALNAEHQLEWVRTGGGANLFDIQDLLSFSNLSSQRACFLARGLVVARTYNNDPVVRSFLLHVPYGLNALGVVARRPQGREYIAALCHEIVDQASASSGRRREAWELFMGLGSGWTGSLSELGDAIAAALG